MYQFDAPQYFYLLLLLPALALVFLYYWQWRRRVRLHFGESQLLSALMPKSSSSKHWLKLSLGLMVVALLSLALVNPKIGTRLETVEREGIDLVFALDVSKSMLTEDVRPNRLERAKLIINQCLDELAGDRVGIITYAGKAYPQLPITTDYAAARLFLKNIDTDLIPSQGTAIGEALSLAAQYFDDEGQQNRLLVILSDGEDHEADYEKALAEAEAAGILITTVGLGTERGGPIPVYRGKNRIGYKKDAQGEVVISKRQPELLKTLAEANQGLSLNGNRSSQTSRALLEQIKAMEKQSFETALFTDYEDQFQWLLLPALILLILDSLLLERKTAWFEKLKLFERNEKS